MVFQLTSSRRGWHTAVPRFTPAKSFQLTSSRRGWLSHRMKQENQYYFNSHPHEEDDEHQRKMKPHGKHFNSHPHEEDDGWVIMIPMPSQAFQLTSSRRGWQCATALVGLEPTFQLTSSRRGWLWLWVEYRWDKNFNSHPHEEDDFMAPQICINAIFQLTSSRRGWRSELQHSDILQAYFNSHPHEEDDHLTV